MMLHAATRTRNFSIFPNVGRLPIKIFKRYSELHTLRRKSAAAIDITDAKVIKLLKVFFFFFFFSTNRPPFIYFLFFVVVKGEQGHRSTTTQFNRYSSFSLGKKGLSSLAPKR